MGQTDKQIKSFKLSIVRLFFIAVAQARRWASGQRQKIKALKKKQIR